MTASDLPSHGPTGPPRSAHPAPGRGPAPGSAAGADDPWAMPTAPPDWAPGSTDAPASPASIYPSLNAAPSTPRVARSSSKHAAARARLIVTGAAAMATVGIIGGLAVAAPPDDPADVVEDVTLEQTEVPETSVAKTPSTTTPAGRSTPSTTSRNRTSPTTPSTTSPEDGAEPSATTPTTRAQTRPHTRSRGS